MDKIKVKVSPFILEVIVKAAYFKITEREEDLSKCLTRDLLYRAGNRTIIIQAKDLIRRIKQKTAIEKKEYTFNFSALDCVLLIDLEIVFNYMYKNNMQVFMEYMEIKTEFDKHF